MQRYAILRTELGPVGIVASPAGLSHLHLFPGSIEDAARLMDKLHSEAVRDDSVLPELRRELKQYFAGRPVEFSTPVDLSACTGFQRRVLKSCAKIGYGKTLSYGELARRIGCPAGARAVGGALGKNPIPLVIPCHRVLASGGAIGGFSAEQGVKLKRLLLEIEGVAVGK